MKQKIDKLSAKEEAWVAEQLEGAGKFVDAFSPEDAGQSLSLGSLDRAFAGWLATAETDSTVINGAINCVGIAFGQILVDGIGLKWVIATDEHGTDLAVYGLAGKGDVLVYPANFVAKRWERRETQFLERSYGQIAEQVAAVQRASASGSESKPWWKFW
jgi:hypothetical protein